MELQTFDKTITQPKKDFNFEFMPGDNVFFIFEGDIVSGIVHEQNYSPLNNYYPGEYGEEKHEWYVVLVDDLPLIGKPGKVFKTEEELIDSL